MKFTFQVPDDWTAEQAEFLSDALYWLADTIGATYATPLSLIQRELCEFKPEASAQDLDDPVPDDRPAISGKGEPPSIPDDDIPW